MTEYVNRQEVIDALQAPELFGVTPKHLELIKSLPAADVVPMDDLKKWLWKVALNNSDNYLGNACAELVSRLDGLRRYVQDGGAKMDEEESKDE